MRIQELYVGKGQAVMTQARYIPNQFSVEYQYRGKIKRETIHADWRARARCKQLVAK
jgi:hypothetical protein